MLGANVKTRDERDDEGNVVELEVVNFLRSKGYAVQGTGQIGSLKGAPRFWLPDSNEYVLSADFLAAKEGKLLIVEAKKRKLYPHNSYFRGRKIYRGEVIYLNEQIINDLALFVNQFNCEDGVFGMKLPEGDLVGQTYKKINPSTSVGQKPAKGQSKMAYMFKVNDFVPLDELV